ncbi:copper chaperone [Streptomyces sp. AJS327]|uniref:heavy-metal-associated domain-containing protein n=1 Tax=Streptomyces sp. AJS327 TaxID=2545265 RepID=UPI0015DF2627|nr:cation transporter [Streptomyces sp. AJS327]MBA0053723.1 copper chaperone [Streptomyces sp. AJS327]
MPETTTEQTAANTSCCTTDGSCHTGGTVATAAVPGRTTTVYRVSGMTCGHCVATISAALDALESVDSVRVELADGTVTVHSAGSPDDEAVTAAIDEVGYGVVGRV